jgi:hypothetical protein
MTAGRRLTALLGMIAGHPIGFENGTVPSFGAIATHDICALEKY